MNSTERSTRVFAGIAAFLVVFSAPRLLLEMFDDSFPTVLLGLTALAAACAVVCLVSLRQRVKRLEMQAAISRPSWMIWQNRPASCRNCDIFGRDPAGRAPLH